MTEIVGLRLQAVRKFYGWSQRELAKRAGVPNSAISVIEQGTVSPSVSSLEKVLKGFPMSLVDFFSISMSEKHCELIPKTVVVANDLHSFEVSLPADGSVAATRPKIHYYVGESFTVSPNYFLKNDCILLVTEGQLTVESIGVKESLSAGESASLYAPIPFRVEVGSDKACWVLATY